MEKKYVQSFERGLDVLAALNYANGATVNELASLTGINRAIVYRLVETLRRKGYVRKDGHISKYWLASTVQSLGSGFKETVWIDDVVRPGLQALGEKVLWPVSVSTLFGSSMVIRASSDYESPLTLTNIPVGFRLPITRTAVGRIYLSFCLKQERDLVLRSVDMKTAGPDATTQIQPATLDKIQRLGYEIQENTMIGFPNIGAIAVPILSNNRILGALALRYFQRAVSREEAVKKYLPELRSYAEHMGSRHPRHGSDITIN